MEEMAELEEMAREKATGMSLLIERDNEIRGIRDGTIVSSRVSIQWPTHMYMYIVCVYMYMCTYM